jgi:16S rRNA C1402 (ribose-2'-O) methylase RsmI
MTKIHEEFIRGTVEEVIEYLNLNDSDLKGEVVIIISVEIQDNNLKGNSLFMKKNFLRKKEYKE